MEPLAAADRAWRTLLGAWSAEPSVTLGLAALGGWYARQWPRRGGNRGQALLFAAGLFTLVLALASPLDLLADNYLFSAHMAQHLLLVEVVPLLLLLGLCPPMAQALRARFRGAERLLTGNPIVPIALASGALAAWHVPTLYEAALVSLPLHVIEHLVYLASGVVLWWPIAHPRCASARLGPLARILYLFAACLPNTGLGAVLTFAVAPFYRTYMATTDPLGPEFGLFPLTRGAWGVSPLVDQQLGGLLMWVPGGLVYLGAIGVIFFRWYAAEAAWDVRARREQRPS